MKTIDYIKDSPEIEINLDRYYYKDIENLLDLQRTAIKTRIKAANIKPHADENSKQAYLDPEQMQELQKVHEFMARGGVAANYQGRYTGNVATPDATASIVENEVVAEILYHDEFLRNAINEISMNQRLRAYAGFDVYYFLNKTISDRECIELIGWKPPRSGFSEENYTFIRAGRSHYLDKDGKLQKQAVWKIEKKSEVRVGAKGGLPVQMAEGESNYKALKELLSGD